MRLQKFKKRLKIYKNAYVVLWCSGYTIKQLHSTMPKPKFFESSNLAHVESKICDGEGLRQLPAGIYLLQINNRNTRKRYEICSKLTIKPPELHSGVFIVNFGHIYHLVLKYLLLNLQVIAGWVVMTGSKSHHLLLAKHCAKLIHLLHHHIYDCL